jgi:hypothetical protein
LVGHAFDFMTPKELQEKIDGHRQEIARLSKEGHLYAAAAVVLAETGKPSQLFQGSQSAEMSARLIAVEQSEIFVAASQLAEISSARLEQQTATLIKFTIGLYGFTIALAFFAVVQIIIMLLDYCSKHP